MGCAASGANDEDSALCEKYAEDFGYAFQIIDDILDFDGNYDTCELNSYVKIHGLEKAKADAGAHIDSARKSLLSLDEKGYKTDNFSALLDYLVARMSK